MENSIKNKHQKALLDFKDYTIAADFSHTQELALATDYLCILLAMSIENNVFETKILDSIGDQIKKYTLELLKISLEKVEARQ